MLRIKLILFGLFIAVHVFSQVNIWEGTENSHQVIMTPYLAQGDHCTAIIVLPGGSYFWHAEVTEGSEVALWLQKNGISAFVLKYRTAKVPAFIFHYRYLFRGIRYPDPQDDLRQALKYVRERSAYFHIDPNKVGVMGFSAGGHLAMSSVLLFPKDEWPFFVAPIYPVITLKEPYVHKRSRRALLGENNKTNTVLCDSLSLEQHVPDDCPPVFLVNCVDDPIVNYNNSVLLDSALTAHGIPHEYWQYQTGGHGFGVSPTKGSDKCRQWKIRFLTWLSYLLNS